MRKQAQSPLRTCSQPRPVAQQEDLGGSLHTTKGWRFRFTQKMHRGKVCYAQSPSLEGRIPRDISSSKSSLSKSTRIPLPHLWPFLCTTEGSCAQRGWSHLPTGLLCHGTCLLGISLKRLGPAFGMKSCLGAPPRAF